MVFERMKRYGELVMISHSLFSLPFGLIAMIWASDGSPQMRTMFWILIALFSARLGANSYNRIADRFIDAKNKRTADRHLATGVVKISEAYVITFLCFILLAVSAYQLNWLCFVLLPFAIALVTLYSYTKRFTWLCHHILGAACACAPVGAWIAVTGQIELTPLILGAGVCFYVGGFDILYAMQDMEFDRQERLYSIPARFGLKKATVIAMVSHVVAISFLLSLYFVLHLGIFYLMSVVLAAILLGFEHVSIDRENKMKMIFAVYGINQIISAEFFLLSITDFIV
jgi:4-hydroxybenzoate polyprenyltransferase